MLMKYQLLTFAFAASAAFAVAQTTPANPDTASFFNLSLEELLNVEVSVASKKALTLRESPGIVTLITGDEIRNSGAHDLIEVLRLVPGIHFGVDVEGVVGIGIRGNWGHEGKVLLLYDGLEMNEQLFSSLQFGEHYPIEQIRKIEIIRGPGSSIYGGYAEYAVINIITNNNSGFEGLSATASYGQMTRTLASRSISVNGGRRYGDVAVNLGLYAGEGNRSDRVFTDYYGNQYDMASNSHQRNWFMNLATSYKGLSLRVLGDYYLVENRDGYDQALMRSEPIRFNSAFIDLKYDWKISRKLSITPQLKYKRQAPWLVHKDFSPDDAEYYKESTKPSASLSLHYDVRNNINVDGGAEYYLDKAIDYLESATFSNGSYRIQYYNSAFYMQGLWSNKIANVTLGARYHLNNYYDPSFVPRIGITKVIRKAHFKVLYSTAYRTPSIENIRLGNNIEPEKTNVAEFETGYHFSENSYMTANVFDITTHDAIVYYYLNDTEGYHNSGRTGTRGFEIDYKIKSNFGYFDLNVAYYTAKGKTKSESYAVTTDEAALLAFPQLAVNGLLNLKLSRYISLNPSVSWMGHRYDFTGVDAEGSGVYQKHKPQFLANIFAGMDQLRSKGIGISVGCANVFNAKGEFIQPYNSNHAPLPGRSREFRVTVRYDLDKNKK
jgi:outer membrane cobalamin receptor